VVSSGLQQLLQTNITSSSLFTASTHCCQLRQDKIIGTLVTFGTGEAPGREATPTVILPFTPQFDLRMLLASCIPYALCSVLVNLACI